jgi:hypothetical protein
MMLRMSKAAARRRSPKPLRPSRDTEHPLVPIVRDKLHSLGDFAHLLVYRQGDHLFIAHPGIRRHEEEFPSPPAPLPTGEGSQNPHLPLSRRERGPGGEGNSLNGVDPVLRITHAGQWRFGLSLRRPNGRWQPVPIAGAMSEVIAEAVRTFGPWLAPQPVLNGTMETVY